MAGYRVSIAPGVAERIRSLPPDLKRAVREAIRAIGEDPQRGGGLQRELRAYRKFRVRRYRIIYRVAAPRSVRIVALGHRSAIYEDVAAAVRAGEAP